MPVGSSLSLSADTGLSHRYDIYVERREGGERGESEGQREVVRGGRGGVRDRGRE